MAVSSDIPAGTVPSPCVRICCLDENDVCLGCFRTITEICAWAGSSNEQRTEILQRCDERAQQMRGKKNLRTRDDHDF